MGRTFSITDILRLQQRDRQREREHAESIRAEAAESEFQASLVLPKSNEEALADIQRGRDIESFVDYKVGLISRKELELQVIRLLPGAHPAKLAFGFSPIGSRKRTRALRYCVKEIRETQHPTGYDLAKLDRLEKILESERRFEQFERQPVPDRKPDSPEPVSASGIHIHIGDGRSVVASSEAPPVKVRPNDLWNRTTFDGMAYDGGVLNLSQGRTVVDLSTASVQSNPLPILLHHASARVVGSAKLVIDRTLNIITIQDGAFLDNAASREVLSGFDPETGTNSHVWQASIGAGAKTYERHTGKVFVNGRAFTNVTVARGAVLSETSFVGLGADVTRPKINIKWKAA